MPKNIYYTFYKKVMPKIGGLTGYFTFPSNKHFNNNFNNHFNNHLKKGSKGIYPLIFYPKIP